MNKIIEGLTYVANIHLQNLEKQEQYVLAKHLIKTYNWSLRELETNMPFSKSGFLAWQKRTNGIVTSKEKFKELDLLVQKAFFKNKELYGSIRLQMYIESEYGQKFNRKTIASSMQRLGLKAKIRKERIVKETKDTSFSVTDKIKQHFKADKPNLKWFTDVTQINTTSNPMFMSMIIDSYNNEIIDYTLSLDRSDGFVYTNIANAMSKRTSNDVRTILHSDHGVEYSSKRYFGLKELYGFEQSMGRPSVSLDNRPAEYFFSILKQECIYRIPEKERTIERVTSEIHRFIHWYNNERIDTSLRMSPMKFKIINKI